MKKSNNHWNCDGSIPIWWCECWFWIKTASPSLFLATRERTRVARLWRPVTRATTRPCQHRHSAAVSARASERRCQHCHPTRCQHCHSVAPEPLTGGLPAESRSDRHLNPPTPTPPPHRTAQVGASRLICSWSGRAVLKPTAHGSACTLRGASGA